MACKVIEDDDEDLSVQEMGRMWEWVRVWVEIEEVRDEQQNKQR